MGHSANPTDLVRKSAALTLLLAFLAFATHLAGTQSSARAPKLPQLALDAFSGVIREQIQKAYDYARVHPNEAQASGALGMILQTYGLAQEAKMYYQYAAELQPTEFRWTYYLGVLEADQGHCDQARSHLQLALRIDPDYVPAALHLANCLFASAEWEASQELYNQVLKQDADNPEAHYRLGRIQSNQRDYKAAVETFGKALASFPNYGAAHYALALAYGALGQTEKAEEQLLLY